MLALLLAAAAPQSALEAERAFAADAQVLGQWTAFRKWAADDATMFAPQPVKAQAWLRDRKEPAKAVEWWPTVSWVSCDGSLAVNTGGSRWPDGSAGYFTTVWQRQADGSWRWLVDGGDTLKAPRPRLPSPPVVHASCKPPKLASDQPVGPQAGAGGSPDRSLLWEWAINATGHTRVSSVYLWNGERYVDALEDVVDVP
jgi:hypothetical protein